MLFGFILSVSLFFYQKYLKNEQLPAPAGAAIMAIGIFIYGGLHEVPLLSLYGEILVMGLAVIWILFVTYIMKTVKAHRFREQFLQNPVDTFAIGTWIAGTSMLLNVSDQYFHGLWPLFFFIGGANVLLYFWYMYQCAHSFWRIVTTSAKNNVHGVLLLATVSTQSIAILLVNMYPVGLPKWGNVLFISLGLLFYGVSVWFLIRKYVFTYEWNIADDWKNTNCIVHGALSITGVAAWMTEAYPTSAIVVIWGCAFMSFIFIEAIEVWRAFQRCRRYGIVQGVWQYDVSQWSRNFTFGMLYLFTASFAALEETIFQSVREVILSAGPWVLLGLLMMEMMLFGKDTVKRIKQESADVLQNDVSKHSM
ncbi:hypothetical protein SAMN05192534_11853 [Alteribacillus persepolensis]|uniref:Voltage-dependent anion channel n=2 Tax=Alteribacillus persepolensis TaxID=568899 RepID=A0A1G8H4P0_9BACI|nr:hypothetical protein SAMN05192534_11853 [Alteribacillus persepolensis]